jgi:hypothetical protein
VTSRSNRGLGEECSRVRRNSLSYVRRCGSCVGCANPNVGMRQTPPLSWRQGIRGEQTSPRSASIMLRFVRRKRAWRSDVAPLALARALSRWPVLLVNGDALMGRPQRNQWIAEFESGAGHLKNPLFLADMTMPSWLDLAESELGVLASQCLGRRIPDKQAIIDEGAGSASETKLKPSPSGSSQPTTPSPIAICRWN